MMKKFIYLFYLFLFAVNVSFAENEPILLDSVTGTVYAGNFTHWSLTFTGHIFLTLHSLDGDADLYVTESNKQASYEPESYDLHSASCGTDTVEIPRNFKRPIGIGIYGHPSHENTSYVLDVFYDAEKSQMNRNELFDDEKNDGEMNSDESYLNKEATTGVRKYKIKAKLIAGLWSLLEIFDILITF